MARLVLTVVGQALGNFILPGIGGFFGAHLGNLAGGAIDNAIFGSDKRNIEGPRLKPVRLQSAAEGTPIPRLYGNMRVSGHIVWATRYQEQIETTTNRSGNKYSGKRTTTQTNYSYYANFAVALCEGPITYIRRIWADGKPIIMSDYTIRIYKGTETQLPDSLIEAKEIANSVPAFRGLAYVVFDNMPLASFGNRIPQLHFEVRRKLSSSDVLPINAVTLTPGATEFGYDPQPVFRQYSRGRYRPVNSHHPSGGNDAALAIEDLIATVPDIKSITLTAAWFGNDLRAGECEIRPGVTSLTADHYPYNWSVNGVSRAQAMLVSHLDGRPVYGGTPADRSILSIIRTLRRKRIKITFLPLLMMDIPKTTIRPNPYNPSQPQPAYPHRSQLTCHPAPYVSGSVDKTNAVQAQINAIIGTARRQNFTVSTTANAESVQWSGSNEWSIRRMVLHYAWLCRSIGGVDAFLIGSGMRGLTSLRDQSSSYPAVTAYLRLAEEVAAIFTGTQTKLSYAADWLEYHNHRDRRYNLTFNLDPLWSSAAIDFVGINYYAPLSDLRGTPTPEAPEDGATSAHDKNYLMRNVAGGEQYEWFYRNEAERNASKRRKSRDNRFQKHWIFYPKDIRSWWLNKHYNRTRGRQSRVSTAWVPQSKPIRFTDTGCPAIDKGTNQPDRFFDPESHPTDLPYFSSGQRDDAIQKVFIRAVYEYWSPKNPQYRTVNPRSIRYSGTMIDAREISFRGWDIRPYPSFPYRADIWHDARSWARGHGFSGRFETTSVADMIRAILARYGIDDAYIRVRSVLVNGFLLDRVMTAREALAPLVETFQLTIGESDGRLAIRGTDYSEMIPLEYADLAITSNSNADNNQPAFTLTRTQASEHPSVIDYTFFDAYADFRVASVEARDPLATQYNKQSLFLPLALARTYAELLCHNKLDAVRQAREEINFSLPLRYIALDPGDRISLQLPEGRHYYRINTIDDGATRRIQAYSLPVTVPTPEVAAEPDPTTLEAQPQNFYTPVLCHLLDLPQLHDSIPAGTPLLAAFADPWPGGVRVYSPTQGRTNHLIGEAQAPAIIGEITKSLQDGCIGRWDRANQLEVEIYSDQLHSRNPDDVLDGANQAALQHDDGRWEIINFVHAQLIAKRRYRLTQLLRGQHQTEARMRSIAPKGSVFIILNAALAPTSLKPAQRNLLQTYRYGPAPQAPSAITYQNSQWQFASSGLKPLSPCHLRARRNKGAIHLCWIRRSRSGGDLWDSPEIPLGESAELYQIAFLDGDTLKTTKTTNHPSYIYDVAEQNRDWGNLCPHCRVVIRQISPDFGAGYPLESSLNV